MTRKSKSEKMIMSSVPATVDDGAFELPVLERGVKSSVLDSLSTGRFLPRIQLMQDTSKPVKQKKAQAGHFVFISGSRIVDLGEQFDLLSLNVRAKAMDMRGKKPVSLFDAESDDFQEIRRVADSGPNSSCTYGPEYLLYVPSQKKFATFFFNSATLRRVRDDMDDLTGKAPATITATWIPSEQYGGWYGVDIVPCSTPIVYPDDRVGFKNAIVEQNTRFLDTTPVEEEGVEEVAETESSGRAR